MGSPSFREDANLTTDFLVLRLLEPTSPPWYSLSLRCRSRRVDIFIGAVTHDQLASSFWPVLIFLKWSLL